jgi:organic radical activating enzyme
MTFIASKIVQEVEKTSKLSLIIQPESPLTRWETKQDKLLEISGKTGKYLDVLVIPQVHKLLNIR